MTPARHIAVSDRDDTLPTTCREEIAFLDRYLASDLSARQRAHFESHLAVCRDCVAFLQTYKSTIELTRTFLSSQAEAGLFHQFSMARISRRAKRS